ncbi:Bug family tripartite tricarboxylate transporter substrate binding protein [Bordetella genomosp. 13]|uniref:Bug family tripartite tricarboxylate transporter substrate binding protein n=1 Tax=Bordetella genomosp. 13 TaxID=463040 RepID=UPI0011A932E4|nr:tripartite tricarboxylate transporter substrate binding protein [Bordetella genomosp. 13]
MDTRKSQCGQTGPDLGHEDGQGHDPGHGRDDGRGHGQALRHGHGTDAPHAGRRRACALLAGGLAAAWALQHGGPARAAQWPDRPIRMLVGYPPGGGTDTVARVLAIELGKVLGQSVVVENRAGASGTIATQQVVRAVPDGYTVLFATASPLTGAPLTIKGLNYDPMADLAPVTMIGGGPFILVANPAFPPDTLPELVKYARAHPGEVNYASPGISTANFFFSELLNMQADIRTTHVPYKGSSALINDLISGQVQYTLETPGTTLPLIRTGKLKPLAIFSKERLARLPEVPTTTEGGFPDLVGGSWYGLLLPKDAPPAIVQALYQATRKALSGADVRRAMEERDVLVQGMPPAEFKQFIHAEYARWKAVTAKLGVTPQ